MEQPTTINSQPSTSDQNEVLVRVEGVSKKFCRDLKKSLWYGVKDVASELLPFGREKVVGSRLPVDGNTLSTSNPQLSTYNHSPGLRPGEFWANKNISFELRRGECLGLIGHNGAGKTTLLKMLNGLIKPDEGSIKMRGRVGALIALGAGFNPILTGRENVYVNGSVLGLNKTEIDAKIDEIIDFAEVREAIDSPVQSYSSGMQVRLGFAVASSMNTDILLLDEVLAVGDMAFVTKCLNRVRRLMKERAVILVSHRPQQISNFCNHVLMLESGRVIMDSPNVAEGLRIYQEKADVAENKSGTEGAEFNSVETTSVSGGKDDKQFVSPVGSKFLKLSVNFSVISENFMPVLSLTIKDQGMNSILVYEIVGSNSEEMRFNTGKHDLAIDLPIHEITGGRYTITGVIRDPDTMVQMARIEGAAPFYVKSDKLSYAPLARTVKISPEKSI